MVPEITVDAKGVVLAAKICFKANRVLKVIGGSGSGKSEIIQQIVDDMRVEAEGRDEPFFFTIFNASLALGPDIAGFLLPFERQHTTFDGKDTFKLREGAYTFPHFLRDKATGNPVVLYNTGVVVIEEWDKASPDCKKMLTAMLWDYVLGEHKIPRGIRFVLLANRAKDRSATTKEYDYSINRWDEINYQPSLEAFNAHFRKPNKRLHPAVSEWVNNGENADIFSGEPPEKQGPWATSRSVETLSEMMYAAEELGLDERNATVFAAIAGVVGVGKAASFRDTRAMAHMLPTYDEVVKNPMKAKVPANNKADACFIIVHRLANKMQAKDAERVVEYMARLPQSFGVAFIKAVMDRDPSLFLNEHVHKWAQTNGDVLAAVNKYQIKP